MKKYIDSIIVFTFLLPCLGCVSQKEIIMSDTYIMFYDNDSTGYSTIELNKKDSIYHLSEFTKVPGFEEKINVYFKNMYKLDSVRVSGKIGDVKIDCFSELKKDTLIGYFSTPKAMQKQLVKLKVVLDSALLLERTLSLFLYAPDIEEFDEPSFFQQYNSTDGKVRHIKTTLLAKNVELEVSAGKFNCRVIEFTGGVATQIFYISNALNKIVKIEIKGQPWQYELASSIKQEK